MAISVINLGTASGTAGATITITGVTVPSGSLIYVLSFERNSSGTQGIIDDGTNSYNISIVGSPNGSAANGVSTSFYAFNSIQLNNATITYTKDTSGVFASMAAFYASGIQTTSDPLDTVTNIAVGNSTTPNVTTFGPLNATGELIVGNIAWNAGTGDTFTQDSINGAYATPPDSLISSVAGIGGGNLVDSDTAPITYAPMLNNSRTWVNFIVTFLAIPPPPPISATLIGVMNY